METTLRALALAILTTAGVMFTPTATHAAPATERQPVVVVVDHTGGGWSVGKVVRAWDTSRHVRVALRKHCTVQDYCVDVYADNFGSEWMGGITPTSAWSATLRLNTDPSLAQFTSDPAMRSAVVCHELAHAFGISHQPPSTGMWGCIANSDHDHSTALPSYRDKRLLAALAKNPRYVQWGALHTFAMNYPRR